MTRRIMIVAFLPLLLAACGCKVNQHIQETLTYQWGENMAPRFAKYVNADETLDAEQKAELLAQADAMTAAVVEPEVGGWNVNREYLANVYAAYLPVYGAYVAYIGADDVLRPRSKKIRIRAATRIIDSIVLLMK